MTNRKTVDKLEQLTEGILNEYDEQCALFEEFTSVTQRLILDLLKSNNVRVHSVTSRVKTKQSISNKIKKAPEYTYQELSDIHDICGIRIITYYPDEVDAVAVIIQKEFSIDYSSSVDKRTILDPDRFGYLSLHYIAKLSPERLLLTEYSRFKKCKTEIQIRSILQHTWAEIEHDLGYKTKLAVPRHIRRRFSQLAGLLELADDTFVQIRDTLADYESKMSDRIKKTPESVQIDQTSLLTFVEQSKILLQIDNEMATLVGTTLNRDMSPDFIIDLIPMLISANIKNIAELSEYLNTHKNDIFKIAVPFLRAHAPKKDIEQYGLMRAVGILYLCYLLLLERSPDITTLTKELTNLGLEARKAHKNATTLLNAYKSK
jgi:ppGpp synthetase/RelA/SpoT-type nucleotidyltranferase